MPAATAQKYTCHCGAGGCGNLGGRTLSKQTKARHDVADAEAKAVRLAQDRLTSSGNIQLLPLNSPSRDFPDSSRFSPPGAFPTTQDDDAPESALYDEAEDISSLDGNQPGLDVFQDFTVLNDEGDPLEDPLDAAYHSMMAEGSGADAETAENDDDLLQSDDEEPGFDLCQSHEQEDDSSQADGNDPENGIHLPSDHLYRSRASLFDEPEPEFSLSSIPIAFDESPILRNVYIRAFVQAAFHGSTHHSVQQYLTQTKSMLQDIRDRGGSLPDDVDLNNMATTLPTVERRLGVAVDGLITYYFVCPTCWDRHRPEELHQLTSPQCQREGCEGILYTAGKRDANRKEKRTPTKILPYASLRNYVQRMFLRPGKAEEVEHWRKADDQCDWQEPISCDEWKAHQDPDARMYDIHDAGAWRAVEIALKRKIIPEERTVVDESTTEPPIRLVSIPYALMFTMNIDWFQPMTTRIHSTGAIYVVVNNLPRHLRFLRENTFLLCVLPGPHEPSKEEMNAVLELVVEDMKLFANGVEMSIVKAAPSPSADEDENGDPGIVIEEADVFGHLLNNCSDSPARSKTAGVASCTCDKFMCVLCEQTVASLVDPNCYDPKAFHYRDQHEQLFWKHVAKSAPQPRRDAIFDRKGVRFSAFDLMPGWLPGDSSPTDPMHCILLGVTATVHRSILLAGGMFNGFRKKNEKSPADEFERFMGSVWWPSWVVRVPPKVSKGNGKIKADQWRHLLVVYAVALFAAWRKGDEIREGDAPLAAKNANVTKDGARSQKVVQNRFRKNQEQAWGPSAELYVAETPAPSRNYRDHYTAIIELLVAVRILLTQSITSREADRAQGYLGRSFRKWASMGCHLTPNFHAAMHLRYFINLFGPVYGWWAYAFERMNGVLGRININGHTGGELEATILRGWLKSVQLQDLVTHMQNLEDKTPDDMEVIDYLLGAMKGGAEAHQANGSFLSYITSIPRGLNRDSLTFPKQSQKVNLLSLELYYDILAHARREYPTLNILSDNGQARNTAQDFVRLSSAALAFSTVMIGSLKYGASTQHRGKKTCFCYIDGRQAVQIEYILTIALGTTSLHCGIVRRFQRPPPTLPEPPWHLYSTDLGIDLWDQDLSSSLEVVPLHSFSSHFAWAPITLGDNPVRVTFSLDHRSQEPDSIDEA